MPLAPLGSFLIAGDVRVPEGVCVPELSERMHELPPKNEPVYVVGPDADAVVDALVQAGRLARKAGVEWLSGPAEDRPLRRLWKPNAWLERSINTREGSALDLGCGTGRNAVYMASLGWTVTAIDHLPDAIDRARDLEARYGSGSEILWQTATADKATGTYDIVVATRFFEPSMIESIPALLRPGGLAYLETFTERWRAKTGHPTDPSFILPIERIFDWPGLQMVDIEPGDRFRSVILKRV